MILDYTHSKLDAKAFELLQKVVEEGNVFSRIQAMFNGEIINTTEKRQVLHVALRMSEDQQVKADPEIVKNVHAVLKRIKDFS